MAPHETSVVFFGSPAFAEPSLRALHAAGYSIPLVVTQPDKPAGRGSKVRPPRIKVVASELGLDVFQPATLKEPTVAETLAFVKPDVFVVAAYGKIIPRVVLDIPVRGSVNVHASLLPRWRGASPIESAILAGDERTGVCIMEVVAKMDAGDVVACVDTPVADHSTATLEPLLAEMGASLLVDTLPVWVGRETETTPQDESLVTYCTLIQKSDGFIPADATAEVAERMVRAFNPWPGAFVQYKGERLAIWKARPLADIGEAAPGAIVVHEKMPAIVLHRGALLVEEVQRQGSKRISGRDFLNGERDNLAPSVALR